MNNYRHDDCRRPSIGVRRGLSTVLVATATLFMVGATGCGAQEPARRTAGGQTVATPNTYRAKIQAARPGDVIVLDAGAYGAVDLNGRKFAEPGVRIEAKPGADVVFDSLDLQGSEGIELRGADIAIKGPSFGVNVLGSSRIRLAGLKIHGGDGPDHNAVMLRDSQDVSVADCDIHDLSTGINFLDSNHLKISGNHLTHIQSDGIRGAGSYVEVIGNSGSSFHPSEGDHPDFIQFWNQHSGVTTGNVIKDNVFERGDGAVVQGIFIEYNENMIISGNAMAGTMYNGISLSVVHGAVIEDNFVQGYADMGTRIIVRGASTDVIVRNNVSEEIVNYDREGVNPRYKEEHNSSIRAAKIGDTTDLRAWVAKHHAH
jgi:nitrous oxidase accessory protein NosD